MKNVLTQINKNHFILGVLFILTFIFLTQTSFATTADGKAILDLAARYIKFIQALFRYLAAAAIIVTVFLFFQQRPIWIMGAGIVICCGIIGNLDKILDTVGLSSGVCF